MTTSVLFIIQIVLSIIISIAVLLQKSSSIGLGVYSGSNDSLFGAKGTAGFLAKLTMVLGFIFIVNTLALGYTYKKEINSSIMGTIKSEIPSSPKPKSLELDSQTPLVPLSPENK